MKKTIKFIIAFILILGMGFNSCTKLDEEVFSEIIAENFVFSKEDTPALLIPIYTPMRNLMCGYKNLIEINEESADGCVTPIRTTGWGGIKWLHLHEWISTFEFGPNVWNGCYNGINTVNRILGQIESGEIKIEVGQDNVIAELKTVRAFYYWNLMDIFGNVPIVTDFSDVELPVQSTRQEVYDFIINEVNENLPLLSDEVNVSTYGRFNKWAAKALLAKIYLNAEIYTGTPQWAKCIQECNDIINEANTNGSFELEANYRDIFKTDNENSKEHIFAIPCDENFATGFRIHMKSLSAEMRSVFNMQSNPWGGVCATPQFIDTYDEDDSRLEDTWILGPQYNATTGEEVINYINYISDLALAYPYEGYRIGKYEIKMGVKSYLSNDYPVFRYTHILMMKAECLLRTGYAGEAAEIVTSVRERSFKSNPAKVVVTGDDLLEGSCYNYANWDNGEYINVQGGDDIEYGRFLDELAWEFAQEGHRRLDMIRFGVFTTKRWYQHEPSASHMILFAIPQVEMNKNPNLVQNPGF